MTKVGRKTRAKQVLLTLLFLAICNPATITVVIAFLMHPDLF